MGQAIDWGEDDDEATVPVTLPWSFTFFEEQFRTIYVGANGNVGFSPSSGGLYNGNGELPSASDPNHRVAAFFADLVGPVEALDTFGVTLPGAVYTYTDEARSRFVIQYTDWADWNSCSTHCLTNTFQIVLHRSGPIAVYYETTQAAPPSLLVGSAQVRTPTGIGLENADGTEALVWPGQAAAGAAWMYRPVVTHTIVYTALVRPEVAAWTELSSTAVLTSTSLDDNLADNTATASVLVGKAELAVTKLAWPVTLTGGDPVTYTVWVTNTGTITLNATITDVLPPGVTPGGVLTWTTVLPSPGGTWSTTLSVLPGQGYSGTLRNLIMVTTSEGATGTAQADVNLVRYRAYLPLVARQ